MPCHLLNRPIESVALDFINQLARGRRAIAPEAIPTACRHGVPNAAVQQNDVRTDVVWPRTFRVRIRQPEVFTAWRGVQIE